jgi:hypothetical protein
MFSVGSRFASGATTSTHPRRGRCCASILEWSRIFENASGRFAISIAGLTLNLDLEAQQARIKYHIVKGRWDTDPGPPIPSQSDIPNTVCSSTDWRN